MECRSLLNADNGKLLVRQRIALYRQFKNLGDSSKLSLSSLRFYAKRLGICRTAKMQKQSLITALMNLEYNSQGSSKKKLKIPLLKKYQGKSKKKSVCQNKSMMRLEPNSEGSSKMQLQIPINFEAKTKKKHASEKKIEPNKKKLLK